MLRLTLGVALLGAQPLELVDGALFIENSLKHEWYEKARNARKPFVSFVFFREFRDSQLPPQRTVRRTVSKDTAAGRDTLNLHAERGRVQRGEARTLAGCSPSQ